MKSVQKWVFPRFFKLGVLMMGCLIGVGLANQAHAQFVWPKASYHNTDPSVYKEDPFITKYRKEFFAVFQGDFKTFNHAYNQLSAMVKKNPNDARALVWLGNGNTIKAELNVLKGKMPEAKKLAILSRKQMDKAVRLQPNDPEIYMMQAATLYIQGQYLPAILVPNSAWEELKADCLKLIHSMGPKKIMKLSVHVRGETYGELGVAYYKLGQIPKAKAAFEKLVLLDPKTDYSKKAKEELADIQAGKPISMANHP